jgi:hypothetical protein
VADPEIVSLFSSLHSEMIVKVPEYAGRSDRNLNRSNASLINPAKNHEPSTSSISSPSRIGIS